MRIVVSSGCPAELARPEGDAVASVVVIPDIFGLRPLFDDLVARIAEEHRVVVCPPEMFPGLDLGGDNVTVVRYPEAEHGFVHDASRPSHRADDAADAWRRCWAFLGLSSPA